MRILSWNVNGFRAVYKKGFIEWLRRESPDVLCLQETKANEDQITKEIQDLTGYHYSFCSAERKGYSGVAILSKKKPLSFQAGLGHPGFDSEGRTLIADFGDFLLFNVYFPNGGSGPVRLQYKMDFYAHFLAHIKALKKAGRQVVVCGDVNTAHKPIDLARPKENEKVSGFMPMERAWLDELVAAGFVDVFRTFHPEPHQYTWWDMKSGARARNVGWRIDYFFVSEGFVPRVEDCFILPEVLGSDHCPVGLLLRP